MADIIDMSSKQTKMKLNNSPRNSKFSSWTFMGLLILAAAVVALTYYFWPHHHKTASYKPVQINSGVANPNPNVPGGQNQSSNPPAGALQSKDTPENTPGPTLSSNIQPAAPTGQFVGNHHPSLSNQNTETSTCVTTPGAYCQIKFTDGTSVKSLAPQKTNADGSYTWDSWTLQSIGLTQGTWQITAIATNGDKTATSQDALQLVVGP